MSTTFVGIAESVCQYLATFPHLNLAEGTNLFAGLIPDQPDEVVAVFERPGGKTLMTFVGPAGPTGSLQPQSLLDQPIIQIRVRASSGQGGYSTANTLMQQVWSVLQGTANQNIPPPSGLFFLLFDAAHFPAYLGQDTQQRPEFSINMKTFVQNTQRIPD